ncbi:hypothetical protein ACFXAS_30525 [Streptomyces sp. NPDC059459]|uniref:hypothetical protein n=1 Tax=Streptomyces sp. NPDC059459 TaxID=3346839 RepID=UPI00369FC18E
MSAESLMAVAAAGGTAVVRAVGTEAWAEHVDDGVRQAALLDQAQERSGKPTLIEDGAGAA